MPAKRVYTSKQISRMNIDFIKEQAILQLDGLTCETYVTNQFVEGHYDIRIIIRRPPKEVEHIEVTKEYGRRKILKEIQSFPIADFKISSLGHSEIVKLNGRTIENKKVIEFLESISMGWFTEGYIQSWINIEYTYD